MSCSALLPLGVLLLAVGGLSVPTNHGMMMMDHAPPNMDKISEKLAKLPEASKFMAGVVAAGAIDALDDGPKTVFVPNDAAFAKVPKDVMDALMADTGVMRTVLANHLIHKKLLSGDIPEGTTVLPTCSHANITIVRDSEGVTVTSPDGSKGKVIEVDQAVSTGVAHFIDSVLYTPPTQTIAGLLSTMPEFSTLLKAVESAGALDTLSGAGPFTLFAPNNAAFAKLPEEYLAGIMADKDKLKAAVLRHVLDKRILFNEIPMGDTPVISVGGEMVKIENEMDHEGHMVIELDSATGEGFLVMHDILATNGVIHVIDMFI